MHLLAPAKINVHLRVGPVRADGFHPLVTWMCTVGLFDRLKIVLAPRENDSGDGEGGEGASESARRPPAPLTLLSDTPGVPLDSSNLVAKAILAWRESHSGHPLSRAGATVELKKTIPMGGGLGGGSSDAARTLLGLHRLWGSDWSANALSDFAARFGSDVPFFLHGPSSVCRGRGEIITPLPPPVSAEVPVGVAPRYALLMLPAMAMPTGPVYKRFDEMGLGRERDITEEPDWQRWIGLDSRSLLEELVNDLEPAAFAVNPALGIVRKSAEEVIGRPVRMSGSGSSLFSLYDFAEPAAAAAAELGRSMNLRALAVELMPRFSDDCNAPAVLA
jgi:4-diphosphocytidyl-2-C-methyl-D-erythritol kinase